MSLIDNLRSHVLADDAEHSLARYLGDPDERRYSGAWFEEIGGRGDSPEVANRFTPADIVAVSTLSVNIPGWAAIDLLDRRADALSALLAKVPADVALHEASEDHLQAVFALQDEVDEIPHVGHVTRSKLLARKRPQLVPIRDQHVLTALVGRNGGSFTRPLRDALASDQEVIDRLEQLQKGSSRPDLSLLRVLDIVVWMRVHGEASLK